MAMPLKIPYHRQHTDYTCGPASLEMVFGFFHKKISEAELAKEAKTCQSNGTMHSMLIRTAKQNGFYCYARNGSSISEIKQFLRSGLPIIVNYIEPEDDEGHYAVVVGCSKDTITLNDPWNGECFKMKITEFEKRWRCQNPRNHTRWMMVLSNKKFLEDRNYGPKAQKRKAAISVHAS